jgi:Xaa-Pro aminopeptidase
MVLLNALELRTDVEAGLADAKAGRFTEVEGSDVDRLARTRLAELHDYIAQDAKTRALPRTRTANPSVQALATALAALHARRSRSRSTKKLAAQ